MFTFIFCIGWICVGLFIGGVIASISEFFEDLYTARAESHQRFLDKHPYLK